MVEIIYQPDNSILDHSLTLEENETLLDGLLRTGIDIPFGCKSGTCQSCLMRCRSGKLPAAAQNGLKPSQAEQGFFLACCCKPQDNLTVSLPTLSEQTIAARVIEKSALNAQVFRLRIEKVCDYKPGQFFTLWKDKHTARSYSIASHPHQDDFIEFHIKRIENGLFSQWAWNELQTGATINIQGSIGNCFYTQAAASSPLFLCGIGTGLAPLYGILRDALAQHHTAPIYLYLGGKAAENFYLVDELIALQKNYANLHIKFIAQQTENADSLPLLQIGDLYQVVKSDFPSFKDTKVFLCGAESFVRKMKKQCFLAGANMKDILADSFVAFGK